MSVLEKKYSDTGSRFITINGVRVHYKDEGKGTTVVLLHGIASSLHTWDAWTAELKNNHRVIRLDIPGFGLTGPNKHNRYDMPWFTDFLASFLHQIGIDSCQIAGNSMGGCIAWEYALQHPEVKKIILIDAVAYPINTTKFFAIILCRIPVLNRIVRYFTPKLIFRKMVEILYGDKTKVSEPIVNRYRDLMLRPGNREAFIKAAGEDWYHRHAEIKKLKIKALILWGEKDEAIPVDHACLFRQDIPFASLYVYKDVGHMPMEEAPAQSLKNALPFLRP